MTQDESNGVDLTRQFSELAEKQTKESDEANDLKAWVELTRLILNMKDSPIEEAVVEESDSATKEAPNERQNRK